MCLLTSPFLVAHFVFSQSRVKVTRFTNVSSLAVTASDLALCTAPCLSCSLSLSLTLVSSGRKVQWWRKGHGVRTPPPPFQT